MPWPTGTGWLCCCGASPALASRGTPPDLAVTHAMQDSVQQARTPGPIVTTEQVIEWSGALVEVVTGQAPPTMLTAAPKVSTPAVGTAAPAAQVPESGTFDDSKHRDQGGWAMGPLPRRQHLAYLPQRTEDPEPPWAVMEGWEHPHQAALAPQVCERLRALAEAREPSRWPDPHTTTWLLEQKDIDSQDWLRLLYACEVANSLWWRLDIKRYGVALKRYRPGGSNMWHPDLTPGDAGRKLAASFQLSADDDYEGGDLVVRHHVDLRLPRSQGAVAVFPGWTMHAVEQITSGVRWSLVNGFGPAPR